MGFKRPLVRIQSLGPSKQEDLPVLLFTLRWSDWIRTHFNATVRWTVAKRQLDGVCTIMSSIQSLGPTTPPTSQFVPMNIYEPQTRTPDLLSSLLTLWESSVRATHLFLSEAEIRTIRAYVPDALRGVAHLVVAEEGAEPVAFMGIEGHRLEMLFLAPQARGKGLGRQLLQYGMARYGVRELTVNEQNPQAVGFYQHMGFVTYKRTDLDEAGAPYPLLYMRLPQK